MLTLKHIYIILILEEIIFISKGKVRCIQTLTVRCRRAFARNVEVLLVFFR
jgi:hypothetical protein